MRKLTYHIVEGDSANHQLTISVLDEPGQGGACHHYEVSGFDASGNPTTSIDARSFSLSRLAVVFQNGPIKEFGVNGVTQEALLAIVIDRLRSFQAGPFACDANELALEHCRNALYHLQTRTRERIARGVEGTHKK